jgi:hypothetical protein
MVEYDYGPPDVSNKHPENSDVEVETNLRTLFGSVYVTLGYQHHSVNELS